MKDIKILLVDDFSTMRRVIKKILKGIGLENVIEADNGMKAWDLINSQNVDIVICDWHMPRMKGLDLLEKIRASDKYADLPFIMVSAEGKKKSILKATEKGVTSYITKPFSAQDLEKILKTMIHA